MYHYIPTILNVIGLIINISASIILALNIPSYFELDENGDIMPSEEEKYIHNTMWTKRGIFLLCFGFFFQFLGIIF